MREDAPQRHYRLRELFNSLRYVVRTGDQWRALPHDLPPWHAVYDQMRSWVDTGVFDAIIADLRVLIRLEEGRTVQPTAVIPDSWTLQSNPERGHRASWDEAKRRQGTTVNLAVDTLGELLAIHVTPAKAQDRDLVASLAGAVQEATGQTVTLAYVDQGYTGELPRQTAADHGIDLIVVQVPKAKRRFVLLPRRWMVEQDFAWMSRFRRLARYQERLAEVLMGLHLLAFVILMASAAFAFLRQSSSA